MPLRYMKERNLALLTLALDGDKWSSLHSSCLTLEGSASSTHGIGEMLGGPQEPLWLLWSRKEIFYPCLQWNHVCFYIYIYIYIYIWLTVHHSITYLLFPTWYTNLLFVYTYYIKSGSSTCFERIPPTLCRPLFVIYYTILETKKKERKKEPSYILSLLWNNDDNQSMTKCLFSSVLTCYCPECKYVQHIQ